MPLGELQRSLRRWRIARSVRAARQSGQGLYLTEWQSVGAPSDEMAGDVTDWCRDTLALCRRPMGIDQFDLTLTIDDGVRPETRSLRLLRPGQLYDGSVIPLALASAFAALAAEHTSTVRIAVALLSWGDIAHAALPS